MTSRRRTIDFPTQSCNVPSLVGWLRAARLATLVLIASLALVLARSEAFGQTVSPHPLRITGQTIWRWQVDGGDASLIESQCVIDHEGKTIHAGSVLVVADGAAGRVRCRVVAADVRNSQSFAGADEGRLRWTMFTFDEPVLDVRQYRGQPASTPKLMEYLPAAVEATGDRSDEASLVIPTQFSTTIPRTFPTSPSSPTVPDSSVPSAAPPVSEVEPIDQQGTRFFIDGGTRSVQILPRSRSQPPLIRANETPGTNETVITAQGGLTVVIQNVSLQLDNGAVETFGTVALSADRMVGWFPRLTEIFREGAAFNPTQSELYLEGDIVFRAGERIIYAQSMYYNASTQQATVLDAEAITTIPDYQGVVRVKAKVLQQIARGQFQAFDAAVTTSRIGVPRYWLQSDRLSLSDRSRTVTDFATGAQRTVTDPFIQSNNNFVYLGGFPVLYWPTIATRLDQPSYYVTGLNIRNDNLFGTQVLVDFDLLQLFGIENAPPGVQWELSTDYLSDRGPALGTALSYQLPGFFGFAGPTRGRFDAWFIDDDGTDNLGLDRPALVPEASTRGRIFLQHRQLLSNDFEFTAQVGFLSDRNFLEQFFENEWDQTSDAVTALGLRRYFGSNLVDLTAQVQVNDFFSETERLPQLDHYLLGGSLLRDLLTYSTHNRVGFNRLNAADDPEDPAELAEFSPLPGDTDEDALVASTKHELALPLQLGPLKVVPNIGGEVTFYSEALDGDSLTRLIGQAGVRASLPFWRVDPTVQSGLLNIRGLAQKIELTGEYFFADSDTPQEEIPFFDELDDTPQEQFRRRFIADTFGGLLPPEFDPRSFVFRQGIQRGVTSPSDVVADDLQQFRLGLHQRVQTKRGLPGRERIVDLLEFDVDTILFPESARDNFGETVGPTTYNFRYHLGDRVALISDGYVDFFDEGLRTFSLGFRTSRPGVGDLFVGVLSLEGPISSTVLRTTVDYRLGEKWIASGGTTYDFGDTGNIGQSFALTRVGESFLVQVGVNVDEGRDNVGVGFSLEPRFFPRPRLGRIGGTLIPPPGVEGLE